VKGAAAAALYGSRANDGVVQIFTKPGRPGALRATHKVSWQTDDVERRVAVNQAPVDAAGNPVTRYEYRGGCEWRDRGFAARLAIATALVWPWQSRLLLIRRPAHAC
jgi:outer membrane cobalamin receptor